jgi:hypothetical protein
MGELNIFEGSVRHDDYGKRVLLGATKGQAALSGGSVKYNTAPVYQLA